MPVYSLATVVVCQKQWIQKGVFKMKLCFKQQGRKTRMKQMRGSNMDPTCEDAWGEKAGRGP